MSDRLVVQYDCRATGAPAADVARAVAVEQTIEFPAELAPQWIQDEVVGRIESVDDGSFTLSFDPRLFDASIVQLVNVLWGNVSLIPGVRATSIEVPESFRAAVAGPRFGIAGLRERFQAPRRPLLSTALKPIGLSSEEFARTAGELATAGIDLIKDDHSLADQRWSTWEDRVARCSDAVNAADTGAVYVPSLNLPADRLLDAAVRARELGAGAVMVLPGIAGFDMIRAVAEATGLPVMAHPSMVGSHVVGADHGLPVGFVLGMLPRLAGADLSVFPNSGGRFSFSVDQCREIADNCRVSDVPTACWPTPGGGMTLEKVDTIVAQYGHDVCLLIGGDLHRGDLRERATAFRAAVDDLDC